jgi:hypothetical protein
MRSMTEGADSRAFAFPPLPSGYAGHLPLAGEDEDDAATPP